MADGGTTAAVDGAGAVGREGTDGSATADEWQRVPFPARGGMRGAADADDGRAKLVRAFVRSTAALAPEAAAKLAAVRPETIRKWRRRAPRWLKADTARRIAAHLAGEAPAEPPLDEGFRRAFHRRLRPVPLD